MVRKKYNKHYITVKNHNFGLKRTLFQHNPILTLTPIWQGPKLSVISSSSSYLWLGLSGLIKVLKIMLG